MSYWIESTDAGFGAMRETDGHALLTPRELEVLAALAEGMTNKAIARRLNISLHTVKFYIESLFWKLGARTRTEAVAKASERRRYETITLRQVRIEHIRVRSFILNGAPLGTHQRTLGIGVSLSQNGPFGHVDAMWRFR
jgi:DNA-binding CsgD family transcriptional regulator